MTNNKLKHVSAYLSAKENTWFLSLQLQENYEKFKCMDTIGNIEKRLAKHTYGTQREPGPYMTCPCCGKKYVEGTKLYI